MDRFCFRPAEESDALLIAQLRQQIWNTTYRNIYPDEVIDGFDPAWHERLDLEWIRCWNDYVVEADRKPVGYLIFREDDPLYLQSLYLLQEWQGKGGGRQAFALLKARCSALGVRSIRFQCSPWNENALSCYLHMGARIIRREEGHENKQEDTLWLELSV